jgi:hypothetical protein
MHLNFDLSATSPCCTTSTSSSTCCSPASPSRQMVTTPCNKGPSSTSSCAAKYIPNIQDVIISYTMDCSAMPTTPIDHVIHMAGGFLCLGTFQAHSTICSNIVGSSSSLKLRELLKVLSAMPRTSIYRILKAAFIVGYCKDLSSREGSCFLFPSFFRCCLFVFVCRFFCFVGFGCFFFFLCFVSFLLCPFVVCCFDLVR